MKKILITLTVLFAVIDIMAQEHLSFKGIPIEGSMTEFCQKLKSKGFTSNCENRERNNINFVFRGTFRCEGSRRGTTHYHMKTFPDALPPLKRYWNLNGQVVFF